MRTRKIAGPLIAATAACLVLAGQASADPQPPGGGTWNFTVTTWPSAGGEVFIKSNGDIVELCDMAADGLAPRAELWDGTTRKIYDMIDSNGAGTCTTHSASEGGIYDIPEGMEVDVWVWLGPNNADMNDGYWDNNG